MITKQEHSSTGDNVAGNKYQQNNYSAKGDLETAINSKISNVTNRGKLNLGDNKILLALKDVIIELIEEEQNKSHQIVPVGKIRLRFKSLFDDDTFETLINHLVSDKSIEIEDSQICFVNKQTNYKVNLK